MSVLIKGMEMPKDGVYWCEIGVAGEIAMITIHGEDRKSFHLVPVPEHGDLIDRDALFKEFERIGWFNNSDRDIAEDVLLDVSTAIPVDKDSGT